MGQLTFAQHIILPYAGSLHMQYVLPVTESLPTDVVGDTLDGSVERADTNGAAVGITVGRSS